MNNNYQDREERKVVSAVKNYNGARGLLIAIAALTVVNIFLYLSNADMEFIFSSAIASYLMLLGVLYTGKLPPEYYEGVSLEFLPDSFLHTLTAVAAVIAILYLVCWIGSAKGRYGFMIAGAVLFIVDTLFMFGIYGFDLSMIANIVFHLIGCAYLVHGIICGVRIEKYKARRRMLDAMAEMNPQQENPQ